MKERELCRVCGGNGTVKIPGGISVCGRCDGDSYEPEAMTDPTRRRREAQIREIARETLARMWPGAPHYCDTDDGVADTAIIEAALHDLALTVEQETLLKIADDDALLEVGRKAVEGVLVEFRDARISVMRNNGLTIREADGRESSQIRFGPEGGLKIGLRAIANAIRQQGQEDR